MPGNVRLAIFALSCSLHSAQGDQWAKTFSVSVPPEILIRATDANVSVKVWDHQQVAAMLTTVGWKISDTGVRVLESVAGNLVELEVVSPKMPLSFGRLGMKLELTVPRDSNCEIRLHLGNVSVSGVRGKVALAADGGDIDVQDLEGKLEAVTNEGKIRASGRFYFLTLSGGFGALEATAYSGSKMLSPWRLGTEDGNVSLRLPVGFGADLDAETSSGRIALGLPMTITNTPDRSKIRGRLNGGGEPLILRTKSGNIRIETSPTTPIPGTRHRAPD